MLNFILLCSRSHCHRALLCSKFGALNFPFACLGRQSRVRVRGWAGLSSGQLLENPLYGPKPSWKLSTAQLLSHHTPVHGEEIQKLNL